MDQHIATGCTIILAWSACITCSRWSGNNYSTHCSYTFSIYIWIYVHKLIFIKRNLFIKEIQTYIHSNMYVMRDRIMIYRYRYRYRERERKRGRERESPNLAGSRRHLSCSWRPPPRRGPATRSCRGGSPRRPNPPPPAAAERGWSWFELLQKDICTNKQLISLIDDVIYIYKLSIFQSIWMSEWDIYLNMFLSTHLPVNLSHLDGILEPLKVFGPMSPRELGSTSLLG